MGQRGTYEAGEVRRGRQGFLPDDEKKFACKEKEGEANDPVLRSSNECLVSKLQACAKMGSMTLTVVRQLAQASHHCEERGVISGRCVMSG